MDAVAGGVGAVGETDVGVDVLTGAPGGVQALEERAVLIAEVGEGVVEAGYLDRGGAGRRPGAEAGGDGVPVGMAEHAGGVTGPLVLIGHVRSGVAFGPGIDGDGAAAGVIGWPHRDLELDSAVAGQDEGLLEGQLINVIAAGVLAAWRASSTNTVPGSRTVPAIAWSASQGKRLSESRPVSTVVSPSARVTAAPSSGWPAASQAGRADITGAAPACSQ